MVIVYVAKNISIVKELCIFHFVILTLFLLAGFDAFENKDYQSMFIYLAIGITFILIRIFKSQTKNQDK